jgi:hypothetical protein
VAMAATATATTTRSDAGECDVLAPELCTIMQGLHRCGFWSFGTNAAAASCTSTNSNTYMVDMPRLVQSLNHEQRRVCQFLASEPV